MTSKQEKLAAARRKLKEFQGKSKEGEFPRQKNITDPSAPKISKDYVESSSSLKNSIPLLNDKENFKNDVHTTYSNYVTQSVWKTAEDSVKKNHMSGPASNETKLPKLWSEYYNMDENLPKGKLQIQEEEAKCLNGLRADYIEPQNTVENSSFDINMTRNNQVVLTERNQDERENIILFHDAMKINSVQAKDLNNDIYNKSLDKVIKPLQEELQNHSQTIKILIQERNDVQAALNESQKLLNDKSKEAEELKLKISHLTSSLNNLSQKLFDAENVIMKLKLEKEETMQTLESIRLLSDNFKVQLETKEEELQEVKRKFEEKDNNCKKLLFSLHEVQSQLSLNQIQLQQYTSEGHSALAIQISELQCENMSLKQKIIEMEKRLEVENAEKEESSQKFRIYAQQCNSQLSSLNSQLKSLQLENEDLYQRNDILSKSLSELEKDKEGAHCPQSFENEIADLHNQLSALCEKNNQLRRSLNKKEEEYSVLENALSVKDLEMNNLLQKLKELEEENRKLGNEAETPKVNERLLATMESDKIAAAKAVSQNQKLKEQVFELEKGFMKLSEEKLELTNQLAHEKHINNELQNLLRNTERKDYDKNDGHQVHKQDCHQAQEKPQSLINDSNEIEELRNIVRQLQDDKIELTARLSLYETNKSEKKNEEECEHNDEQEHEEAQCENTKLLLQQMEEKVRKTMNEIAILDEEKEKLEHLVLQLQGETETIGEYITLYQKQRMLLRQRAQEKDIQLMQLSKDKEELKLKLEALDGLVQRLIVERESVSAQPGSNLPHINSSESVLENTATRIRALINEIGSTTLINNHSIAFEHCCCCSGRLITI